MVDARKLARKVRWLRWLINIYPPLLGAGVRVRSISPDMRQINVSMPLRWYNRNYVGVQYGGSLCSMIDPFYMLMLVEILGPDYIVWDKSVDMEFVAPGRGEVFAEFYVDDALLERVRSATATGEKYLPVLPVTIVDGAGNVIAKAQKTLYIRRKMRESAGDAHAN